MTTRTTILFLVLTIAGATLLLTSGLHFIDGLAVIAGSFVLLWLLSLALGNAAIADTFWGPGFVVVGVFYLVNAHGDPSPRGFLVVGLTTIWAARLAIHIGIRSFGAPEDFRYRRWREEAGTSFWWISLFKIFLLQALLLWIVSSPLLLAQLEGPGSALTARDFIGIALFVIGFSIESTADYQLTTFKRDPSNRGRILRTGLWGRSRHPNYFGEAVLWWGLGLLAFPTGGWLALIGPALITFLLMKVSGVAMLDAALVDRRPGYADYIRSTPAFFPRLRAKPADCRDNA
jgi:steroid 5-alpha reductase family enzyme